METFASSIWTSASATRRFYTNQIFWNRKQAHQRCPFHGAASLCSERLWERRKSFRKTPLAIRCSGQNVNSGTAMSERAVLHEISIQPTDYSFYQRMRPSAIDETFLWERRLLPVLGYLPYEETARVREALSLAFDAHKGQRRKSGEPFITHPVEVTRILGELRMDWESLAAGLLHDTVEDCGDAVGLDEIGFAFGSAVKRIVEGETKFSKLPTHHPEKISAAAATEVAAKNQGQESSQDDILDPAAQSKAQDLQFLFLAMTEEVRIIVVKLADRLHNMRTMDAMPPAKQRRIAQETLTVFAPLARLLGLYTVKEELEELSFKYAMPTQCGAMKRAARKVWEAQRPALEAAAVELEKRLRRDAFLSQRILSISVKPVRKSLYAMWRKLQDAGRSTRDLGEVAHLQVVLEPSESIYMQSVTGRETASAASKAGEKQLCYHVMGLIHSFWAPVPGSIKDYIATPKPNNYQSLHTTVLPTGLAALSRGEALDDMEPKKTTLHADSVHEQPPGTGNGDRGSTSYNKSTKSGPALFPVEVQIRTFEMEKLARFGIAVESWSCADYGRAVGADTATAASAPPPPARKSDARSRSTDVMGGNGASYADEYTENHDIDAPSAPNGAPFAENGSMGSSLPPCASANGTLQENGRHHGHLYAGRRSLGAPAPSSMNGGESGRLDPQIMSRRINWLNSIRQWQEEFVGTLTAQEFVACVTDDLLGQGVFVFTPSGQVMRLPKGSTVVDFAYHIHTDIGNTMVAARVNGKIVNVDHELANAEVVEVITYKGPINATIVKRHQKWLEAARTKTARYKLAKFLREHAALAAAHGLAPLSQPENGSVSSLSGSSGSSSLSSSRAMGTTTRIIDPEMPQCIWLLARCSDRHGLLADIANVIARNNHNIKSYSGSVDQDAGLFVMEYELEGPSVDLQSLCQSLSDVPSVQGWAVGCSIIIQQR